MNEEVSTGSAMASHAASDGRRAAEPDGWAAGKAYFNVDGDTFARARLGRQKGRHWSTMIGKSDTADAIRAYSRKKGNPDIFLRNSSDGTFMYAQKNMNKK